MNSGKQQHSNDCIAALNLHAGLMIQSAARILGSVDEAQDVVQDIAEKLLRSPPDDVRSWPALLKTMSVNAAIDRLRRRRDETEVPELATDDNPETALDRGEKAQALRQAIARLSKRDATLFSLYYLADLPQAAIGRQLDMSTNAVGVALHRMRERLAQHIDPSLKGETSGAEL